MSTMCPLIKIIKNQLILAIVTSIIESLITNYPKKMQMIKSKTKAGLIKITTITLIVLTTQEQVNMILAEMIK